MNRFTIGRLASEAGVTVETVRYYERRGLLARPPRPGGTGYREYSARDLAIIQHIKAGKTLGFQLREMRSLIPLLGQGPQFCDAFRDSLRRKLTAVREEQQRLRRVEKDLEEALGACMQRRRTADCPIQRQLADRDKRQ